MQQRWSNGILGPATKYVMVEYGVKWKSSWTTFWVSNFVITVSQSSRNKFVVLAGL